MQITIFGANGPTGRLTTRRALEAGHQVVAVTRRPDDFPLTATDLRVIRADVGDPEAVAATLDGSAAVLSVLGVPFGRRPVDVYSTGIASILSGMTQHGIRRLVCVSSSVLGDQADEPGGFFFRRVLQPFVVGVLGRTVYADMRRMETILSSSTVDWTVLRPSGLFDADRLSDYLLDGSGARFTARIDLADALVRQLADDCYLRRGVAVGTTVGTPTTLQMIRREAFKKS